MNLLKRILISRERERERERESIPHKEHLNLKWGKIFWISEWKSKTFQEFNIWLQNHPKDFSNYQNPIDLLLNLRDGNRNLKEVLKNQINFQSDLGEIKKGNPNLKSEDQINVMQNVKHFLV